MRSSDAWTKRETKQCNRQGDKLLRQLQPQRVSLPNPELLPIPATLPLSLTMSSEKLDRLPPPAENPPNPPERQLAQVPDVRGKGEYPVRILNLHDRNHR